jgi:glycosyltransferase involved in cell wall biosynthesis
LKIAFVSHVLPPSWSGQSVMIGRILRNVPAEEYCLISTENYQNKNDQNVEHLPGKYYTLPKEPMIIRGGKKYWIINWVRAFIRGVNIAKISRKEKCDVIIAASGNLIDIPAGWWASVLTHTSFVPYLFDDYLYQWPDEQTRSIARKMEHRIYGRIKRVFVPNEFLRDEIQNRHNVKATVVRNPCANTPSKDVPRNPVTYDLHDEIRIVYTGAIYHVNFEAFKNLIAAVSEISQNVKIHIYTAQPVEWLEENEVKGEQLIHHYHSIYSEIIKAQNKAHILFLPFSFNTPIPEVIRTSAPGKTGEYLASGVPILVHVPPDSFLCWYFNKHDCGLVVDKNDSGALKTAIVELINNPSLRQRLSENAKERAFVDFDPTIASRTFLQAVEA